MNRKLFFALIVLLLAGALAACNGTVPSVTIEPTAVIPTEVPPTAVPSPTPTTEPTIVPTPTEVPLYVGLPADEVEALREQCLQMNPGSLCLPLPVDPTMPGMMLVEESGDGYTDLVLTGTDGVTLASPLDGPVNYERNGDGPGNLRPDRTLYLRFTWSSGLEVSIVRPDPQRPYFSLPIADADIIIFNEEEPRQEFGGRILQTGEIVARIAGSFQLNIYAGMVDLLRTDGGSIVYVLPNASTPEVTPLVLEPWEAFDLVTQECRPVEGLALDNVGDHLDVLTTYVDGILDFVLEPGPERDEFQAVPFFVEGRGCAIAIFNPEGEPGLLIHNGVLIYETVSGEIRVIYTNPEVRLPALSRSA